MGLWLETAGFLSDRQNQREYDGQKHFSHALSWGAIPIIRRSKFIVKSPTDLDNANSDQLRDRLLSGEPSRATPIYSAPLRKENVFRHGSNDVPGDIVLLERRTRAVVSG